MLDLGLSFLYNNKNAKTVTRNRIFQAYPKSAGRLLKADNFSSLDFSDYESIKEYLKEYFWFEDSADVTIKL